MCDHCNTSDTENPEGPDYMLGLFFLNEFLFDMGNPGLKVLVIASLMITLRKRAR